MALRARATARPAPERVVALLARHEEANRTARHAPAAAASPKRLEELRATQKAAKADAASVSAQVADINERINALIIDQRRHRRSLWRRWLPDPDLDAALIVLRERRDALRVRASALAQIRLGAEVDEDKERRALAVANATAAKDRNEALNLAGHRLAVLARARMLLSKVPALAYIGGRRLLGMAVRIEKAREDGYDAGPAASELKAG